MLARNFTPSSTGLVSGSVPAGVAVDGQIVHGQLDALAADLKHAHGPGKRVRLHGDLGWSIDADDEEARRLAALSEQGEQVDRGRIAPLQVVEDEHEGDVGGQRLGQGGELAHHALGAGCPQRAAEGFRLVGDQPRHLR